MTSAGIRPVSGTIPGNQKSRRAGKLVYYCLDDAHIALLVQLGLTHQGHRVHDHEETPDGLNVRR
jgi:ribosomal protein S2